MAVTPSYSTACIVHFIGEGNFPFPPKIGLSLSGVENGSGSSTLSLLKASRRESHLESKSLCLLLSLPQSVMSYCELTDV